MELLLFPTPPLLLCPSSDHLLGAPKPSLSLRNPRRCPTPFPRLASHARSPISVRSSASASTMAAELAPAPSCTKWMVVMEKAQNAGSSKREIIDYYVETLAKVLGSEREAQMCIYDASWQRHYGFCCDIDEESSRKLAAMPGVLSVRPDKNPDSDNKDYTYSNLLLGHLSKPDESASRFTPFEGNEYWLVRMKRPGFEVVTKAQMVDYYTQILTKVLGNEKDAQVCIYHISWEKNYGFCCRIDEECAQELADVPGVFSVHPDTNFESDNKEYSGDERVQESEANQTPDVRTKRLFVTGLSFYTSEKTLRAAFESYGELVEVKIIMDKISKRSKGYAFIEYTTEEAAAAALKEMNGKIINGWMIVVDVAKTNRPRYGNPHTRPSSPLASA
ncbi:hypothetical protein J5N97_009608 [Dioscorea zingiberensis]|uniref:Organelle RRM domain-containing protein 1, chloroplastic n=1 Tax=Dioscorea zingiberensis TaxID=325984 RepID=A0A9D5CZP2_9LILI|nr:hypothetical protein J5N97_009608 [Dioscorea zingiberensis]